MALQINESGPLMRRIQGNEFGNKGNKGSQTFLHKVDQRHRQNRSFHQHITFFEIVKEKGRMK